MKPEIVHPKLAYSIREACHASSLGKTTLYSYIANGRLKAVRIGGRTVIPADSLHALVNGSNCEAVAKNQLKIAHNEHTTE